MFQNIYIKVICESISDNHYNIGPTVVQEKGYTLYPDKNS